MSYKDNFSSLQEAFDRKRAKYIRRERLGDRHDSIKDLTEMPRPDTGSGINRPRPGQEQQQNRLQATVSRNSKPSFATVPEDKTGGLDQEIEQDEYEKYNAQFGEAEADQLLLNQGATILYSGITLTDSSGRNKVLVRRDDDDEAEYY